MDMKAQSSSQAVDDVPEADAGSKRKNNKRKAKKTMVVETDETSEKPTVATPRRSKRRKAEDTVTVEDKPEDELQTIDDMFDSLQTQLVQATKKSVEKSLNKSKQRTVRPRLDETANLIEELNQLSDVELADSDDEAEQSDDSDR